jgi:para-nitrobenzyl esterase
MPIMSGSVEDEENFFLADTEYTTQTPYSAAQYAAAIAAFPATSNSFTAPLTIQQYLAAHYPLISSIPPGPQLSYDPIGTAGWPCVMRRISKVISTGHSPSPIYTYEFQDRTAPFYFPAFFFPFESLAYHTSDIQYLFPLYHGGPAPPSVAHALNSKQEISLQSACRSLDRSRVDWQSERRRELPLAALPRHQIRLLLPA